MNRNDLKNKIAALTLALANARQRYNAAEMMDTEEDDMMFDYLLQMEEEIDRLNDELTLTKE